MKRAKRLTKRERRKAQTPRAFVTIEREGRDKAVILRGHHHADLIVVDEVITLDLPAASPL